GMEEGIVFNTSWGPKRVIGENGKVKGLEVIKVKNVYDEQGRFNPSYIPGTERIIKASNILLAVGQSPDMSFMDGSAGFELDQRKLIKIDPQTLSTSKPGVFACGDILRPGLIINAVASGQFAAQSIHQHLGGTGTLGFAEKGPMESIPVDRRFERFLPRLKKKRMLPDVMPAKKRLEGWQAQEYTYSEYTAKEQGERCLNCNVSPVILPKANCVLCGGCVDVCPTKTISMTYFQKADLDSTVDSNLDSHGLYAGLVHDEEKCIHCGLCGLRCPVDAISMIKFEEMQ
ncbi:MAG TPA: FAD-dependent oxidoreductase, partial [Candidatus Hypogeohydataceae bacterium YC40]